MNTAPAFLRFANTAPAALQSLSTQADNRFLADAAGQVLHALAAKQTGHAGLVRLHLNRAQTLWLRAQECEPDQERRIADKVEAVREAEEAR